jgi:hypothetical protein
MRAYRPEFWKIEIQAGRAIKAVVFCTRDASSTCTNTVVQCYIACSSSLQGSNGERAHVQLTYVMQIYISYSPLIALSYLRVIEKCSRSPSNTIFTIRIASRLLSSPALARVRLRRASDHSACVCAAMGPCARLRGRS